VPPSSPIGSSGASGRILSRIANLGWERSKPNRNALLHSSGKLVTKRSVGGEQLRPFPSRTVLRNGSSPMSVRFFVQTLFGDVTPGGLLVRALSCAFHGSHLAGYGPAGWKNKNGPSTRAEPTSLNHAICWANIPRQHMLKLVGLPPATQVRRAYKGVISAYGAQCSAARLGHSATGCQRMCSLA